MKRIVTSILTVALSLTLLSSLASCGSREKTDLSGVQNISELSGATLGAQTGTFHLTALDQVDGITKKDYPDFTDLLNAVKSGAIDGYVAEEPTAYDVCAKDDTLAFIPLKNNDTGFTATDEETGIAVAFKKGSDMTAQVSEIISSVSRETREELMRQVVEINASPTPNTPPTSCSPFPKPTAQTAHSRLLWNAHTLRTTGLRLPTRTVLFR